MDGDVERRRVAHETGYGQAHISSIFTKLDLANRTQIAVLAYDAELA